MLNIIKTLPDSPKYDIIEERKFGGGQMDRIKETLFSMKDEEYRTFLMKLMPDIDPEKVIGVRTPALRRYALKLFGTGEGEAFILDPGHHYYEENNLHAFIVSEIKEYGEAMTKTEEFLPYVDNWATCDMFRPKIFQNNCADLLEKALEWCSSDKVFTARYGIGTFISYFCNERYSDTVSNAVATIPAGRYYVDMARAWYFATALAYNFEKAVPFIERGCLDAWTHNKAISKACDSRRVSKENKDMLRKMKVKKRNYSAD